MKYLPLVWAMLWRSRTRTALTMLSIAVAFLLFGLLQSVAAVFQADVKISNAENLYTAARAGVGQPLPLADRKRIEAIPGVRFVTPVMPMEAWYQDPKNQLQARVIDLGWLALDPRMIVPKDQLAAARQVREGIVVGRDIAQQFGWKLGDRVPIQTSTPQKDGSTTWSFVIAGIFDFDPRLVPGAPALNVWINFDYVDEARLFDGGHALLFCSRIAEPADADRISAQIDALFRNSAAETVTQTEAVFHLAQANEFADVGLIVHGILTAVFFTLVLVAGNTMVGAFRERIPELAALKTIGFGDRRVAALMTFEATLLTSIAGFAGLALATALGPQVLRLIDPGAPSALDFGMLAAGAAGAVALGLVAALIPAWQAARLTIVGALAGE